MFRKLITDRIVDALARVAIVAVFIAVWGAVLGVSARHSLVKRIGSQSWPTSRYNASPRSA